MDLKDMLLRQFISSFEKLNHKELFHPQDPNFFNRKSIKRLKPFTKNMELFHPQLRQMLQENKSVRKWEYGMMLCRLPDLKNKNILDIGSGPSFLPVYLAQQFKSRVTVLDLPAPFTVKKKELAQRLERTNIKLKLGDMRDMPFKDKCFDIVISVSVIEHLSHSADHRTFPKREQFIDDTKRTLRQMIRVLKPGGWLYLTSDAYVPGRVDKDQWVNELLNGEPYGAYPINQIEKIFIHTLKEAGAIFPYPMNYGEKYLINNKKYSSYRHRFMTVFNVFAQRPPENGHMACEQIS